MQTFLTILGEPIYWYACERGHPDAFTTSGLVGKRCRVAEGQDNATVLYDRFFCDRPLYELTPAEEAIWRIGGIDALREAVLRKLGR